MMTIAFAMVIMVIVTMVMVLLMFIVMTMIFSKEQYNYCSYRFYTRNYTKYVSQPSVTPKNIYYIYVYVSMFFRAPKKTSSIACYVLFRIFYIIATNRIFLHFHFSTIITLIINRFNNNYLIYLIYLISRILINIININDTY